MDKESKMRETRVFFILLLLLALLFSPASGKSKKTDSLSKHMVTKQVAVQPAEMLTRLPFQSFGGPNSYGYTWLDSDDTGGPTYSWIDISSVGTAVQDTEWKGPLWPEDDGTAGPYYLGFEFVFMGNTYDSIYIGTNGILSFTESDLTREGYFHYGWIPYLKFRNALAPFHTDLNLEEPYGGGNVYYWTNSADSFIIQYNVKPYVDLSTDDTVKFEIILAKADSSITYQYKTVTTPNSYIQIGQAPPVYARFRADSSSLIGIQDHSRYFGLRYFAYAVEGYENLPEENLAVKIKRSEYFTHNVVPVREIICYSQDNPYLYAPYHLYYSTEVDSVLSENEVNVINTGENQENNIPVVCKIFKKDNAGGYTQRDSSENTISSLSAGGSALADFSDSWAPDQRGSYLVTYYTALQSDELASDDTTSGYLFAEKNELFSTWADTIPTCNGILEPNEWSDAVALDISRFAVPEPISELRVVVGPNFYESDAAILYTKNDSDYLYLGFDLLEDTSNTANDWISIDIDDDGDRFFDLDLSEGQIILRNNFGGGPNDAAFFASMSSSASDSFVDNISSEVSITGWEFGIQSNNGHQQAEVRIPFGSNPAWNLNSGPGSTFGVWIGVGNAGDPYWDNGTMYSNEIAYWPWQAIFSFYPQKIARIHLSSSSTSIEDEGSGTTIANSFKLHQNYPNPFNPTTVIYYDLPHPARVEINVYNILGQKIETLINGFQPKGKHSVTWEGKDLKGRTVASGIYFYKIVAGDYTCVRKMIMLK
jgi:hypothetical protein